jgi:diguanylate cyclase (GGDEF)-like protein
MPELPRTPRRVPIASRFWLVLGVLVAAVSVMGAFGFSGLRTVDRGVTGLQASLRKTTSDYEGRDLMLDLQTAMQVYVVAEDEALETQTRTRVDQDLARLEVKLEGQPGGLARQLDRIAVLWRSRAFDIAGDPETVDERKGAMARRVGALLQPLVARSRRNHEAETERATEAATAARAAYARTRNLMIVIFTSTLLLGVGLILWLIRVVVPRTRTYSSFAAEVAGGQLGKRLSPRGSDELADLGRSLDDLVTRHEDEADYQRSQAEFAHAMQVTASDDEANTLIQRHLKRSIAGSTVVVLNRNNSDDRLEARTAVEPGSAIAEGLDGAGPRSCLAIRFASRHQAGGDLDPLLSCEVCGKVPDMATCDPLLVGGEVIGSVLVNHAAPLDAYDDMRIRETVTQAAPVLANLRNLAIAEVRAATDALTGLPNNRAVRDTLKRMVAQASRSQTPMAVALLDLDRFKQINDTYGHGRGDEVLAVVAHAMSGAVREGDFVGRYGGEEFVIALPDTGLEGALTAAEKIRVAIEQISLPSIDRPITASVGVAMLPDDGHDTDMLVRNADRALYDAKSKGRNRVECAGLRPEIVARVAAAMATAPA